MASSGKAISLLGSTVISGMITGTSYWATAVSVMGGSLCPEVDVVDRSWSGIRSPFQCETRRHETSDHRQEEGDQNKRECRTPGSLIGAGVRFLRIAEDLAGQRGHRPFEGIDVERAGR